MILPRFENANLSDLGTSKAFSFKVVAGGYVEQPVGIRRGYHYRLSFDVVSQEPSGSSLMLHTAIGSVQPNFWLHARDGRPTRLVLGHTATQDRPNGLVQVGIANGGRILIDNVTLHELPPGSLPVRSSVFSPDNAICAL